MPVNLFVAIVEGTKVQSWSPFLGRDTYSSQKKSMKNYVDEADRPQKMVKPPSHHESDDPSSSDTRETIVYRWSRNHAKEKQKSCFFAANPRCCNTPAPASSPLHSPQLENTILQKFSTSKSKMYSFVVDEHWDLP